MNKIQPLVIMLFVITGCASTPDLEGEIISSKLIGQGFTEHIVQTTNDTLPYFKIITNKKEFHNGSKVEVDIPESCQSYLYVPFANIYSS